MEKENLQWSKVFTDKPIPKATLDFFQAQLMAQIAANPVDFRGESQLAARRKWGLGLAFSLMITGVLWTVLWFGSEVVLQGLVFLIKMFAGIPYGSELQQFGLGVLGNLILFQDLRNMLYLLWEVVSWPLLGVLCIITVFRVPNNLYKKSTIKEA